jgi:hypothetical protein
MVSAIEGWRQDGAQPLRPYLCAGALSGDIKYIVLIVVLFAPRSRPSQKRILKFRSTARSGSALFAEKNKEPTGT